MISLLTPASSSKSRSRRRRLRPTLDVLEARQVLSTLTVTTIADDGPGSLRAQVAAAASGDTINFAHSLNNKTILLTSGTITSVGKNLTIDGLGASHLTVSGGGTIGLFSFSSADPSSTIDVKVSDLTLANGSAAAGGGAIESSGANLTLEDDVFRNNTAGVFGGAVNLEFPAELGSLSFTVTDTRFEGNSAAGGGAIQSGGYKVTISGSTFVNNTSTANFGGGVILGYGPATVTDTTFRGNQGGAMFYFGAGVPGLNELKVSDSTFRQNTTVGFGAAINSFGETTITDSVFQDNSATTDDLVLGGAVHTDGQLTIAGSRFSGNRAQGGSLASGGAVYINGGKTITITDTVFTNNVATSPGEASGGAVYWESFGGSVPDQTFTVSDVTFENNRAVGISITPSIGARANAGALFIRGFDGAVTIEDSTFRNNSALAGDNPTFTAGGTAWGGALYVVSGGFSGFPISLTIRDTSFTANTARSGSGNAGGGLAEGGAVYLFYLFTPLTAPTVITGSTFTGNSVISAPGGANPINTNLAHGGAIFSLGALNVSTSAFLGNSAVGSTGTGGRDGGDAEGGAIWGAGGTIEDSVFVSNSATGGAGSNATTAGAAGGRGGNATGGALQSFGGLTVETSVFLNNQALGGRGGKGMGTGAGGAGGDARGGGISFESADPSYSIVLDSFFIANQALGGQGGSGSTAGAAGQGLGGGIAILSGSAKIKRTLFHGNRASTAGNDIYGSYS